MVRASGKQTSIQEKSKVNGVLDTPSYACRLKQIVRLQLLILVRLDVFARLLRNRSVEVPRRLKTNALGVRVNHSSSFRDGIAYLEEVFGLLPILLG